MMTVRAALQEGRVDRPRTVAPRVPAIASERRRDGVRLTPFQKTRTRKQAKPDPPRGDRSPPRLSAANGGDGGACRSVPNWIWIVIRISFFFPRLKSGEVVRKRVSELKHSRTFAREGLIGRLEELLRGGGISLYVEVFAGRQGQRVSQGFERGGREHRCASLGAWPPRDRRTNA